MKGLLPRQRLFIEAYISTNGNATESARRAGYKGKDSTLAAHASRLLRNGKVAVALEARVEKALEKVHDPMTPEEVIQLLSDQARGGRFFTVDPVSGEPFVDLRAMEKAGQLHLVKKVTRHESSSSGEETSSESKSLGVELYSSQDAAVALARIYGMEKRRPEEASPLDRARTLIIAILESPDRRAYQQMSDLARKVLPGPEPIPTARRS